MNASFGTISIAEILWTICALPGLLVWLSNLNSARRDLRAVNRAGVIDGRYQWAKFSVLLTSVFSAIETLFLLLGLVGMLSPQTNNSTHLTPTGYVLTLGLLGSSALITLVGVRWRMVSNYILSVSRINAAAAEQTSEPIE